MLQARTASPMAGAVAGEGAQRFAPLNSWPDNVEPRQGAPVCSGRSSKVGRKISWADLIIFAGNCLMNRWASKDRSASASATRHLGA